MEADQVVLKYRQRHGGSEWQEQEYPVALEWTDCNLGGRRVWFRCPAQGCDRRVAVRYLGGAIFACRQYYALSYGSQREAANGRVILRADRIRSRLGWDAGILNGAGDKPKGMHWRTYARLKGQHDACVEVSLAGMAKQLGLINRRLAILRGNLPDGR